MERNITIDSAVAAGFESGGSASDPHPDPDDLSVFSYCQVLLMY